MASAADHMAANLSLANFAKATDLKKRLWFTLSTLIVFRLLSFVPLPGIDPRALATLFDTTKGGVLDFFNTFSGGSLQRMSIIALGVMPYITASIVVQLATSMSPTLAALKARPAARRSTNIRATAPSCSARSRAISSPSASRAGARPRPARR